MARTSFGIWLGSISKSKWLLIMIGVLLGTTFLRYGIGFFPKWEQILGAAQAWPDPLRGIDDGSAYLVESPLTFALLGIFGIHETSKFALVMLSLAFVALTLPLLMPEVRRNPGLWRIVFLVLTGGTVGATLFTWMGSYDAVSVICVTVAVLSKRLWACFLGWFLFAFNHAHVAVLALAATLLLEIYGWWTTKDRSLWRPIAVALSAVGLGYFSVTRMSQYWGLKVEDSRWAINGGGNWDVLLLLKSLVPLNQPLLPLIVFSALGTVWLVLLDRRLITRGITILLVGIAVSFSLAVPLIASDTTRILALSILPACFVWAKHISRIVPTEVIDHVWKRFALVTCVVPVPLVHGAINVYYPGFPFGVLP